MLSAPVIATVWPSPTSARRSAISQAAVIGFATSWRLQAGYLRRASRAETDLPRSVLSFRCVPIPLRRRVRRCCFSKTFAPRMAFARTSEARLPLPSVFDAFAGFLIVRTAALLATRSDFVVGLRRLNLFSRRPPARRLLGHYRGRTFTGKFSTASWYTAYHTFERLCGGCMVNGVRGGRRGSGQGCDRRSAALRLSSEELLPQVVAGEG